MKELFEFFRDWGLINQKVEISDPSNPNQCMDLAYLFVLYLHFPKATIQHTYAYQVYTEPSELTRKYFDLIPNTPTGVPGVGDFVVFGKKVGTTWPSFHISIATGEGNTRTFVSLDENWPIGTGVHLQTHDYTSIPVLGWLRAKLPEPTLTTATKIDLGDPYGVLEAQAIRSKIGDGEKDLAIAQAKLTQVKPLAEQIVSLTK